MTKNQTSLDGGAFAPGEAAREGKLAQAIWRATLVGAVLSMVSIDAASSAQRCMVTDPTGTPLNVLRFDGKVIGALHNGEIVRILRERGPAGKTLGLGRL